MKRTLIALLIVMLLVAGTAFGVARWLRCRSCDTVSLNLRALNLTATQTAEMAKLDAEYQKRLEKICGVHCTARADLAESLDAPAKAAAACQRMCDAQTDSEKAALEHILKVRALLTPEQQRQYAALVQQQLTGTCLMRVQPGGN